MSVQGFTFRLLAGTILSLGLYSAAHADVVTGSSSAFGESVDINADLLGILSATVTSGPLATASGAAPAPYSTSGSAASASVIAVVPPLGAFLGTGILNAAAQSDVTGTATTGSASATASVANVGAATNLLGFLGVSATVIGSSAQVSGGYGALTPTGSTTIAGLTINGLPVLSVSLDEIIATSIAGLTIELDKQTTTGDGVSSEGLTVDAIDINFDDVLDLVGLDLFSLSGDIIIDQSEAELTAIPDVPGGPSPVPEPGTLALFASGLFALGLARRRRRA